MKKNNGKREKIRGEAYISGFLIRGFGIEIETVVTYRLKEDVSPKEFLNADLSAWAQWHGAEHKLINAIEDLLKTGGNLTLEKLKKAPLKRPCCFNQNKELEEPSEGKLKEALLVGKKFLRELNHKINKAERLSRF